MRVKLFSSILRWKSFSYPTYFSVLLHLNFRSRSLPVSPLAHSRTAPDLHPVCGYVCPPATKWYRLEPYHAFILLKRTQYKKQIKDKKHKEWTSGQIMSVLDWPFHMSALQAGLCHHWTLCTCCRHFGSSAGVPLSVLRPGSSHSQCTLQPVCQSLLSFLHNRKGYYSAGEKQYWYWF